MFHITRTVHRHLEQKFRVINKLKKKNTRPEKNNSTSTSPPKYAID